ncbi:MAG: flagellar biosynthesis anti-sigma factor FlgM [Oscillospiraceae bacterium]|nr:flagellar biosynthesis anti-sigma factor FlgM [Oscillospiraceae bacterium]
MLAPSGPGRNSALRPFNNAYLNAAHAGERSTQVQGARASFDSFTASSDAPVSDSFRSQMEVVGRLTQEIRTANSTGDIQALRQRVADGTYIPDPAAIAASIVKMGV